VEFDRDAAAAIGRVTSFSTCSGEAPGYWVSTQAKGSSTFGMLSTPSERYENRPSTIRPTMTMVAKTGWRMLTLVIHIISLSWQRRLAPALA
jgi:hypothetical protein